MAGQNILQFYGSKLDLRIDFSETYDFTIDSSGWVDLILDYSEEYDFQLDNSTDLIDYSNNVNVYEINN